MLFIAGYSALLCVLIVITDNVLLQVEVFFVIYIALLQMILKLLQILPFTLFLFSN